MDFHSIIGFFLDYFQVYPELDGINYFKADLE